MVQRSRGALIVFEGCDRAGKSIQARRVLESIEATGSGRAQLISFPDRTSELGKLLDRYLKKQIEMDPREAHLAFAANRQALFENMKQELSSGTHLIVDRYAFSGIAYTLAKGTPGLSLKWAKMADAGILKPDLVLFLDVPPEKAEARDGFGIERFEASSFQKQVYAVMKTLIAEDEEMWKVVDAAQPIDQVFEKIWCLVEPILSSAANKPFSFLEVHENEQKASESWA